MSTTSALAARRSTRPWYATSRAANSSPISALSCWSAAPGPARRIWRSRSPALASAAGRVARAARHEAAERDVVGPPVADHLAPVRLAGAVEIELMRALGDAVAAL